MPAMNYSMCGTITPPLKHNAGMGVELLEIPEKKTHCNTQND